MLKRLIVNNVKLMLVLAVLMAVMTSKVSADEQNATNCVQVTQYGGGVAVVCGVEHKPVETGLADVHPTVLASIFFIGAGYALYKAKKLESVEVGL